MFFGQKLKELRMKDPYFNLRVFAEKIGMKPSELSNIEHGYISYPREKKWIYLVTDCLKFCNSMSDKNIFDLMNLWHQSFVMQKMPEDFFPLFVHDVEGNPLSKDKIIEVGKWMNDRAKEHNKKAAEYNKKHGNKEVKKNGL